MTTSPACPVVAVGAIHHDTIAHAREPIRPETSTPARLSARPGGVATNLARALVRLGVPTRLVGALGDDGAAQALTGQLEGEGIRLAVRTRPGFVTGQYLALHGPSGALTAACVDDRVLAEAPPDLFDGIIDELLGTLPKETIWFVDANLPEAMLVRLGARLGSHRLIANAVSDAKAPRLKPLLGDLECLMLNRGEAAALTALDRETAPEALASALAQTGLRRFVLTSGAADILVLDDGTISRFTPQVTRIVDVTGAGDALMAATIAALARGTTLGDAVPYGLAAAALTLASTGALAEDLSWDALQSF
ncbi:PfkB family carbohydrate kinase [Roseibium sp. Sym1]|uniref:PfkB family carbohydrate kinase n=1 Tax=Roseibium sp. Sym1 TaxID=3016006 RepID=UPI0022B48E87|nr:PfkB family carbohydrate kinase [Roseibium sp. Sym1]